MKNKWIGILDCNNFYVSCERLFRPDLQGKPVVVLSSNDGCVVARSEEIKDMGVPMGVPYFQVKDTLNKANTKAFSSHFALYRDLSSRVFTVMREELDLVEEYSIDEAFFAVAGEPKEVALRIKQAVETRVGIPVSIGIARTKTLAKYANSVAKKQSGVFHLTDKTWTKDQAKVAMKDVWGVGGRTELAYKQKGILTVADLLETEDVWLKKIFGINGLRLKSELSGAVALPLSTTKTEAKSVVSSRSFSKETSDINVIKDAVAYHLCHALSNLRRSGLRTSRLRVYLGTSRHGDFLLRGGSREAVLVGPTSDQKQLLGLATKLVDDVYEAGVPYKKAGVSLHDFVSAGYRQESLFATEKSQLSAWEELSGVVDSLNQRTKGQVVLGSRLRQNQWQAKQDMRSPAYTTSWEDLVEVKA